MGANRLPCLRPQGNSVMLTVFVMVQTGVNLVLTFALFLLLRERARAARLSLAREDRLEALAAEFCALGRAVAARAEGSGASPADPGPEGHGPAEAASAGPAPQARPLRDARPTPCEAAEPARPDEGEAAGRPALEAGAVMPASAASLDRLQAAALLLDQGLPVAAVAAKTAVPDGEVQVLRNLRRAPARRRGRAPDAMPAHRGASRRGDPC